MDRSFTPQVLVGALDRAVAAVCEGLPEQLDEGTGDGLLLDLTRLEAQLDTFSSTVHVLMKHMHAA